MQLFVAVLHVAVDAVKTPPPDLGPFGFNEPTWIAFGTAASALAALVTAAMAIYTRNVARATRSLGEETRSLAVAATEQMAQTERHHLDSLTPLLFAAFDVITKRAQGTDLLIVYDGVISNAGTGPAVNIEVLIIPTIFVGRKFLCGMLAGNATQVFKRIVQYQTPTFASELMPYFACILYDDIFARRGAVSYIRIAAKPSMLKYCSIFGRAWRPLKGCGQ